MDFDLSPRRALAALTPDDLPLWHVCYCPQEGLEMRPRATLANVERDLRAAGDDSRPLLRVLVRAGRL